MSADTHIINKQVFEFECSHSEHAFQIRGKTDHIVQDKIAKAIDRICSQLTDENEDIRIPLLEIDLGRISFNKLEEEIVLVFEKKFYEKLSERKKYQSGRNMVLFAKNKSSFEIVKYFFLTGRLPWFAGKQEENYLADLFDEVFTTQNDALRRFILLNLNNGEFIERLTAQPHALHIERIIRLLDFDAELVSGIETLIRNIVEEIFIQLQRTGNMGKGENNAVSSPESNVAWLKDAGKSLIENLENNKVAYEILICKTTLEFILKLVSGENNFSTPDELYETIKKMLADKFEFRQRILHSISLKENQYNKNLPAAINQAKSKLEKDRIISEREQPETGDIGEALKFYISNAGLVLIANYLPAFFNELKLLDQGNFTDKSSQVRAVFLLHYMCTGKEEVPEHILPLNKILCGLSLDEPLPSSVLLSGEEKGECEELINEIIKNWQRIGNSSIEGFREAFLNREGILTQENTGWKLHVERKGHDVLLESLPWSFNHIKLSWMQDLITTEW